MLCLLSRITLVGSSRGSMTYLVLLVLGPLNGLKCGLPFCDAGLKFNQRAIGYSRNPNVTIVPGGLLCQASLCCSSQGSQLSKVDDKFSPLAGWLAPSSTMKASH